MTTVVIEERLTIPADIDSLEDFREWAMTPEFPERGVSYIKGKIEVDMSPDELNHNKAKGEIYRALRNLLDEHDFGELFTDGALLSNLISDLSTTPDAVFVSYESLTSGRVKYIESHIGEGRYVEMLGAPDMVLEVVSRTSVRKDTVSLRQAYWDAEITEYWLADVRGEEIYFRILRRDDQKGDWVETTDEWQHSDIFGKQFRLVRSRNPVGHFSYRLESQ